MATTSALAEDIDSISWANSFEVLKSRLDSMSVVVKKLVLLNNSTLKRSYAWDEFENVYTLLIVASVWTLRNFWISVIIRPPLEPKKSIIPGVEKKLEALS
jgi:hypothetical protein